MTHLAHRLQQQPTPTAHHGLTPMTALANKLTGNDI
jgi:hypothetical protein